MKVCLLVGSKDLGKALGRYLKFVIGENCQITIRYHGDPLAISRELLYSDLWICEAIKPDEPENPEGWRTAKILPESTKRLIFFLPPLPQNFPLEGRFWITFPFHLPILKKKIENIMNSSSFGEQEFEEIEAKWPFLKKKLKGHHH